MVLRSITLAAGLAAGAWLGQVTLSDLAKTSSTGVTAASPPPLALEAPGPPGAELQRPPDQLGNPWPAFERPGAIFDAIQTYLMWLEAQPVGQLGETLELYTETGLAESWHHLLRLFHAAHWADHDLQAVLAHLRQAEGERSLHEIALIHAAWTRRDPEEALASAAAHPRSQAITGLCLPVQNFYHPRFDLLWAERAGIDPDEHVRLWMLRGAVPEKVLENILAVEGLTSSGKVAAIESVFGQTASIDAMSLEGALALVEQIPETEAELRAAARQSLLEGWGSHNNPLTALKAVYALTDGVGDIGRAASMRAPGAPRAPRPFSSTERFTEAMNAYPDETIRWILEDLDRDTRATALGSIYSMSSTGQKEDIGWLDLYQALPADERPSIGRVTPEARELATKRPREMLDWLVGFPLHELTDERDSSRVEQWTRAAAGTLATQNPDEALAHLETMEEGTVREAVAKELIEHFSRTRPELARSLFDELPDGAERLTAEGVWLGSYVDRAGIGAGIEYLENVDDPAVREKFVEALVENRRLAPADVAQLVDRYCRNHDDPLRWTHGLMEKWAESDPKAAGEWFTQYPDSPSFPDRVERLMERWRYGDFDAAVAFAQTLPQGEALDSAIFYLTALAQDVDPHAALEWQARMSDPEKRLRALEKGLVRVDERAAQPGEMWETLDSLPISEPERNVLRERLGK